MRTKFGWYSVQILLKNKKVSSKIDPSQQYQHTFMSDKKDKIRVNMYACDQLITGLDLIKRHHNIDVK